MTFEDLMEVYERHGIRVSVPDLIEVVRALRDELRQECYNSEVDYCLNEILGSDAGEKVGGGARRDADHEAKAPPTDPAPAVKELVKELGLVPSPVRNQAALTIERLVGEVEQWRAAFNRLQERALAKEQALADCTAERDRLKAALVRVKQFTKGGPDHVSDDDITEIFKTADTALGDAS